MRKDAKAPSARPRTAASPLLAVVCHDLRAPLAAVTMGTTFALQTVRREDENARPVRVLEAVLRSCSQMERLIRNFADISEIENGAVDLRLGLHDGGELMALAATAAAVPAKARSIQIDVVQPESPMALQCDRERVLRAIGHVLDNAIKFAPENSTVTLSLEPRTKGLVAFVVADRGPGLTAQVRRHLFDRQWHAKRASRMGAGFGLAIARGIFAAHGGRIVVESRPHELTTFALCLPRNGLAADAKQKS